MECIYTRMKMNNKEYKVYEKYPHFIEVMNKMCNYVGITFKKLNPTKPEWYIKYAWTIEQQEDFKQWFINYIYINTNARKEIFPNITRSKKMITEAVDMFILQYGWKLVEVDHYNKTITRIR